jgi:hypothetical protein
VSDELQSAVELAWRIVKTTVRSRSFSVSPILSREQERQLVDSIVAALNVDRRGYITTRAALDAVREYVADCDDMLGLGVENIIERHEEANA